MLNLATLMEESNSNLKGLVSTRQEFSRRSLKSSTPTELSLLKIQVSHRILSKELKRSIRHLATAFLLTSTRVLRLEPI